MVSFPQIFFDKVVKIDTLKPIEEKKQHNTMQIQIYLVFRSMMQNKMI